MGRKKVTFSSEEIQKARLYRDQAQTVTEFRKALAVILIGECGFDPNRTADILGTSRRTILRDRLDLLSHQEIPPETKRLSMTSQEEHEFLSQWEQVAAKGILSVSPIHAALVERLGRDVALTTTYRLLARHGWRRARSNPNDRRSDFVWKPSPLAPSSP